MGCQFSDELLNEVISFHGHSCPGLTIGIRAAEYALQKFAENEREDLICITETDMCGVDAIQYLTPCTFGKGNLIHRDYGKAAFSFYKADGSGAIRLVLRPDAKHNSQGETPDRDSAIEALMEKDLTDLFTVENVAQRPPRGARVLASLTCESCQEETMESRTRRFAGQTLCIPCFRQVEQKQ